MEMGFSIRFEIFMQILFDASGTNAYRLNTYFKIFHTN